MVACRAASDAGTGLGLAPLSVLAKLVERWRQFAEASSAHSPQIRQPHRNLTCSNRLICKYIDSPCYAARLLKARQLRLWHSEIGGVFFRKEVFFELFL